MDKTINRLQSLQNQRVLPQFPINHSLDMRMIYKNVQASQEIKKILQTYPDLISSITQENIKQLSHGVYVGSLNSDGKPHGKGSIKYYTEELFYGNFKDGKANGEGLMIYEKYRYYYGNFIDNQFEGKGQFYTANYVFKGYFKNNRFEGEGVLQFNNEDTKGKFQGTFVEGFMSKGVMKWQLHLKKNQKLNRSINGTLKYTYKGSFKNNLFDDQDAQLKSPSGKYQGGFKQGKKHGKGKFMFKQKYQYIGNYKDDLKNGYGTLYNPTYKVEKGRQVAFYSEEMKDISYQGQFNNNLPHGKGSVYHKTTDQMKYAEYVEGIWSQVIPKK